MDRKDRACKQLYDEVIDTGLCCFCGACSGGCPYLVAYEGRTVLMDECALTDGRCYRYCPRTPTDVGAIFSKLFGAAVTEENLAVGVVNDVFLGRSTDPAILERAQDGGVVTTLLAAALQNHDVSGVVCSKMSKDKVPAGFLARTKEDLLQCAGTSYESGASLQMLNKIPLGSKEKVAIAGLPCQVAATAKMKTLPATRDSRAANVGLVVGLFCNWSLSPVLFHKAMKGKVEWAQVVKFDAAHPPSHSFEIYSATDKQSVGEEEMSRSVNPFCDYCIDMPSVFADVSVGSGRTAAKGWNIVVVRTEAGARAVDAAKKLGLLETQPVPARSLEHMKKTSQVKVKRGLKKIVERTGDKKCLLYLELPEGVADKLLA